jgi:AAA domain
MKVYHARISQGANGHNAPSDEKVQKILRRALAEHWLGTQIIERLQIELQTETLPPVISARSLCANPPPTPPEIIEGILHRGGKMALGGGSKSFKTWTLLELAVRVATGQPWLGFPTTAGRVLYLNFELPDFSMERRIRDICEAICIDVPEDLMLWNLRSHAADAATILPMIGREAKAGAVSFIILDPLYKLLGGRDENSSRDMADLMNNIENLAVNANAAVVFGSHYSKGNQAAKESIDRISGSGVLARDPDSLLTFTQHQVLDAFTVDLTLRNFPPQEPFVVRREHPLIVVDGKLDPANLKKPKGRDAEHKPEEILEHFVPGMKTAEWQNACEEEGIPARTFYRLRKRSVTEGRLFKSEINGQWTLKG